MRRSNSSVFALTSCSASWSAPNNCLCGRALSNAVSSACFCPKRYEGTSTASGALSLRGPSGDTFPMSLSARMDAETDCLRLACARVPSQMVSIGVARCSLRLLKSLLVGVFARLARGSDSRGLDSSIADRGTVTGDSSPAA